jgi:hypothetical protein
MALQRCPLIERKVPEAAAGPARTREAGGQNRSTSLPRFSKRRIPGQLSPATHARSNPVNINRKGRAPFNLEE